MLEVFEFIFNCISKIVLLMDEFVLWKGFTFLDFSFALILIPCIIKLIGIIRAEINLEFSEDVDEYEGKHAQKYGGYKPRHAPYEPRHARK